MGMQLSRVSVSSQSLITRICGIINILGIAVLILLTCMTVTDVVGRYFFKAPILGATEVTQYMMVAIVYLCIGWCAVQGKMIVVDLLLSRFPKRVQAILNCVTLFLSLGLTFMITWRCVIDSIQTQNSPSASPILRIPTYPFTWIMTVGFAVLFLAILVLLAKNLGKAVEK
jgi:TRAP-type transport system small permease protein